MQNIVSVSSCGSRWILDELTRSHNQTGRPCLLTTSNLLTHKVHLDLVPTQLPTFVGSSATSMHLTKWFFLPASCHLFINLWATHSVPRPTLPSLEATQLKAPPWKRLWMASLSLHCLPAWLLSHVGWDSIRDLLALVMLNDSLLLECKIKAYWIYLHVFTSTRKI